MSTGVVVLQTLLAGAFGASVGSFLNVIILRTHANKSFVHGRSACPHCGRTLHWYEMIPLVSFVALGGRCRTCRKTLTVQYLLLECLTAAMFMTVWLRFGWSWLMPLGWIVGAAIILIAIFDARWGLIPDGFSGLLVGSSVVWAVVAKMPWVDVLIGAAVGVTFFGLQHLLSKGRWVGSGDIFLGLGLGALLGWRSLLTALVIAYLTGAIMAAVMILRHRASTKSTMAFGPYLMMAGFVTWLWGPVIVQWYLLYVIRF